MEMSEQQIKAIKAMIIMNIIDNCTMELDNTGQKRYSLNEEQFGKCVDTLVKNINVIQCCMSKAVKLSLPDENEINSMQLEMDCPTPNEEEYTTSGFKSGVRWLKNTIERQLLKGNGA